MRESRQRYFLRKQQTIKIVNVITYLRVSTEEQTVEPQRLELKSYCDRQGWRVVAEHTDVISGAKAARPGLDSMLAVCSEGGVDAIAVVKLDRIGRSVLNVAKLIEQLDKMGVALICTTQGIDTRKDNPCGRLQLAMLSAVAAFERDLVRERTIAGIKVARAAGKLIGKISPVAPTTNEGRAEVVAQWYAETGGVGVRKLAKMLGGVSLSTAGKWATKYRAVAGSVASLEVG